MKDILGYLLLGVIISIIAVSISDIRITKQQKPKEPIVIELPSPVKYDYKGEYELTWYCEGTKTASGNKVNHNLTAAADVGSGLKFNDVVYVDYLDKPVVIHDTGSAIKGNKLDIYINDCEQAIKNGRKKSKVYLIGG